MPIILRDVSREIAGNGRYIINFSPSGRPISKRMREVLDNNAGFKDTVLRWQNLGGHAMHFFNLDKLELLVGEGDVWSDINVIRGYPHVADADKLADQFLRYGYECRERFNPIVHEFNINDQGKTRYKGGQSIASVRVADLKYPNRGFEYLIRHIDGTISVGRLHIPDETQRKRHTRLEGELIGPQIIKALSQLSYGFLKQDMNTILIQTELALNTIGLANLLVKFPHTTEARIR